MTSPTHTAREMTAARLILMCGLPGSGKTTLARALAKQYDAVRLSPDEWLDALGSDGYDENAREHVEALQWHLAQDLLSKGMTVILENGFWGRAERDSLRHRAREIGARVELCFLDVAIDMLWSRLEARNASLPDGSFAVSHSDLIDWSSVFEAPTSHELSLYDDPVISPSHSP